MFNFVRKLLPLLLGILILTPFVLGVAGQFAHLPPIPFSFPLSTLDIPDSWGESLPIAIQHFIKGEKETTNQIRVKITYYGFSDNDPPGRAIAYPRRRYGQAIHDQAGGVGTFSDPVTLAVKKDRWPVGTKFYLPYLKKYGVVEDLCASCDNNHLDVWMESNGNFESDLYRCQNHWTRNKETVEINPSEGREVNTLKLFDLDTGTCI